MVLKQLTNVNILVARKDHVRTAIPVDPIPALDNWRVGLLNVMLEKRRLKNFSDLNPNKKQFDDMLESLCKSKFY